MLEVVFSPVGSDVAFSPVEMPDWAGGTAEGDWVVWRDVNGDPILDVNGDPILVRAS